MMLLNCKMDSLRWADRFLLNNLPKLQAMTKLKYKLWDKIILKNYGNSFKTVKLVKVAKETRGFQ